MMRPAAATPPLRMLTLGELRLVGPAGDILPGRTKLLVLLAYLARCSSRPVPREDLATLLWGEKEESRARQSLRHALLELRRAVGDGLEVTPKTVRLAPDALELDASAFVRAVEQGRPGEAVARWGGEFLHAADGGVAEGCRIWIERERQLFRRLLAGSLERLVDDAAALGALDEAVSWAERWSKALPFDERAQLRLMQALARDDRTAEALARHGAFVVRMRDEAGLEPSAELLRLADELRSRAAREALPGPASAAIFTPDMVGRAAVLDALSAAWRTVQDGSTAAVLVEGEQGIGRTRLCAEFLRCLSDRGESALILETRADPVRLATARRLFAGLRHARGLAGAADEALGEVSALVPSLRERFPSLPQPTGSPEALASALVDVLRDVAAEVPVLLVIDDAARADEASQQLLATILRTPPPSVLIVLATRTDELVDSPVRAVLRELPNLQRLKLQPLGAADVEVMLDSMLALGVQPRRTLAARLHAETGGNPFYITELVAALADSGSLALDERGTWQLPDDFAGRPLPVPSEVRQTIRARVERLSVPARQALHAASVLGTRSDLTLLEAIAGLAPDELAGALDDLVSRRLLRPSNDAGGYEFTREITWRATYDNVPAARRMTLHAAALAALDGSSFDDSIDRLREYHRERAGTPTAQSRDARRTRRRHVAATAALLLAASGAMAFWNPGTPAAGAQTERRVAVGSFTNETGDPALDLIGPIAADWLIQGIARTGAVQVVPLSFAGAADHAGNPGGVRDLAMEAQADVLIQGAYHVSGDSIHLRARIIDVRRGELLQAVEPVGAPVTSPMTAVEALRERTLGSLVPWVDPRMAASARMQGAPPGYESYRLFAQGLEHSYRRDMQSIDYFLRAYALDTSYAAPLLHVTSEYRSTGQYAAADSTIRRLLPRRSELTPYERYILDWHRAWLGGDLSRQFAAVSAAAEIAPGSRMAALHLPGLAVSLNRPHRAVELFSLVDSSGAEAQSSSYWVWFAGALHMTGAFDRQLEIGRLVQQRFPQDPRGLSHQARALAALGRLEELDAVLAQSLTLPVPDGWEPTGLWIHLVAFDELADHGHAEYAKGVIERALRSYGDVPPDIRDRLRYRFALGQALFRAGRLEDARDVFEQLLTRESLQNEYRVAIRAHIAYVAARQGDVQTVREIDDWLRDPGLPYLFGQNTEARGVIAGMLGDRELAVRLLRQATSEGRPYDSSTRGRYEFTPLRGYAPFEQWVRPRG